jgi:signal transduction histidine kinase
MQALIEENDFQEELVVDKQRIKQVLINLIQNAQKFTYRGHIKIIVKKSSFEMHRHITFTVEDTGIGMKADERDRLAQLLTTGVKSSEKISSNTAGFGIGLYISNKIAENLSKIRYDAGGGIQFETHEHKGSRFWFSVKLPP